MSIERDFENLLGHMMEDAHPCLQEFGMFIRPINETHPAAERKNPHMKKVFSLILTLVVCTGISS